MGVLSQSSAVVCDRLNVLVGHPALKVALADHFHFCPARSFFQNEKRGALAQGGSGQVVLRSGFGRGLNLLVAVVAPFLHPESGMAQGFEGFATPTAGTAAIRLSGSSTRASLSSERQ